MSTLVVDTLTNQEPQLCKAWVNFNGTGTVAIRASYNVSSITDNGTGDYTVNLAVATSVANGKVDSINEDGYSQGYQNSTTSIIVQTRYDTGTFKDSTYNSVGLII